jgi:hypothetical protein
MAFSDYVNSGNDVYAQIGAAKIFCGTLSNSIEDANKEAKIKEIQEKIQEAEDIKDEKTVSKLKKKLKRLQNKNKIVEKSQKIVSGATDVLVDILGYLDVGKETIIEWLTNMLVAVLPNIEMVVKTALLTNIKETLSCNLDFRIPDEWRTDGVFIEESSIDPRGILFTSPLSKLGRYNYSGAYVAKDELSGETASKNAIYCLARAEDMNAFIWFAKNCATFANSNIIDKPQDIFENYTESLYNCDCGYHKVKERGGSYLPGSTFKAKNGSNTIFLCINRDENLKVQIVPVSNTWTSINWYGHASVSNVLEDTNKSRKSAETLKKEKPLFRLEYNSDSPQTGFNFKILPKPFQMTIGFVADLGNDITVIGDKVDQGVSKLVGASAATDTKWSDMKWPGFKSIIPKTARFNEHGAYDEKGIYSIDETKYYVSQVVDEGETKDVVFKILSKEDGSPCANLKYEELTAKFILYDTNGKTLSMNEASVYLTECYFGTTVYKFNYDYIMSLHLFDASVVAGNIINGLLGLNWVQNQDDKSTQSNSQRTYINNYVDKLVEKIISKNDEDEEFTGCFYTFSNDDYVKLEEETNKKFANGTFETDKSDEITAIYDTLDSYSADASLEERTEIIKNALLSASTVTTETTKSQTYGSGSTSSDETDTSGFIKRAVKLLANEVVNSLLTPKVLMLLMINKKMMGNDILGNALSASSVGDVMNNVLQPVLVEGIDNLISLIKRTLGTVIKEVIDTIQKELLRVALSLVSQIISKYTVELAKEYVEKWTDLLKEIISCLPNFGSGSINSSDSDDSTIDGLIDNVDYADIEKLVDQIMPNTKTC